jgi:hypothetical protein
LLPTDTKVNEEAAKTLLIVAPDIKEAALSNPRLDADWLGASLETDLIEQSDMMEKIAFEMHLFILKGGHVLEAMCSASCRSGHASPSKSSRPMRARTAL